MLSKTNIYNDNWVDMVFEDRNQQYGAFQLRKKSAHYTTLAVILAIVFFGLTISAPMIVNYFSPTEEAEVFIPKTDILPDAPPPIDEPKIEEPPPPPPPPVKSTIIFVKQEVIREDFVEEEPITLIDETKDIDISNVTVAGDPDADIIIEEVPVVTGDGPGEALDFVQQMPEFPGGEKELTKFLAKHLTYPVRANENGIQGRVQVGFIVEKDGSITDIKIVGRKTLGYGLEEEALRVVKMMPRWKEGKQNGNAVRVKFTLPITFKLQQ